MKSLTYLLRELEDLPAEIGVDKHLQTRKLFEQYRQNYPLLERAIVGEYSFREAVEPLTQKHQGIRLFLPCIKDKKHDQKVEELRLEGLLGDNYAITSTVIPEPASGRGRVYVRVGNTLLTNPVGGILTLGALFVSGGAFLGDPESIGHMPIMKVVIGTIILGGFFGLVSSNGSISRYGSVREIRKDAEYLDAKVRATYPQSRPTL